MSPRIVRVPRCGTKELFKYPRDKIEMQFPVVLHGWNILGNPERAFIGVNRTCVMVTHVSTYANAYTKGLYMGQVIQPMEPYPTIPTPMLLEDLAPPMMYHPNGPIVPNVQHLGAPASSYHQAPNGQIRRSWDTSPAWPTSPPAPLSILPAEVLRQGALPIHGHLPAPIGQRISNQAHWLAVATDIPKHVRDSQIQAAIQIETAGHAKQGGEQMYKNFQLYNGDPRWLKVHTDGPKKKKRGQFIKKDGQNAGNSRKVKPSGRSRREMPCRSTSQPTLPPMLKEWISDTGGFVPAKNSASNDTGGVPANAKSDQGGPSAPWGTQGKDKWAPSTSRIKKGGWVNNAGGWK